jgi:hypothetical protein
MIKVLMTKTSDYFWYQIKTIPNLESLISIFKDEGDLILQNNWHYKEDPKKIANLNWSGMTLEDAKEISECEYMLEIYDTYRE